MKQNVIDKRALEHILTDQKNEITGRREEALCHRNEERLVDLGSPQAQVVIGVRRCGKSTLCIVLPNLRPAPLYCLDNRSTPSLSQGGQQTM